MISNAQQKAALAIIKRDKKELLHHLSIVSPYMKEVWQKLENIEKTIKEYNLNDSLFNEIAIEIYNKLMEYGYYEKALLHAEK